MSMTKKEQRLRRSRQTRTRIALQRVVRLAVHRSNQHIYASIVSDDGSLVLASASTAEKEVRDLLGGEGKGGNVAAATLVGKRIAEKAKAAGIEKVAFDRSGFAFHGRVKAVAEAAREAGLQF
ncbi:MAG: 50S ribosomal protein L18 [Rubrivivax sp.]|nr:50S ribosomal protein L18 [Rubrivivax sp.]MDP3612792.1 50S ribosomal protein L18 [Rubrivivax sp.]